jgi:hypothetical protein
MNDLQGQPGEIRMTIQIKRAATGETETHELVGKVMDEVKEQSDGGNALDSST